MKTDALAPGKRNVREREQRDRGDRKAPEEEGARDVQRGGRDDDGGQEQQSEGVLDAAREEQKDGQLRDVVAQERGRLAHGEPLGRRIGDRQNDVQNRARADDDRGLEDREVELQKQAHDQDGGRLADHGEPSEIVERAQSHARGAKSGLQQLLPTRFPRRGVLGRAYIPYRCHPSIPQPTRRRS